MLSTLKIKNVALAKDLEIEFAGGLNIISGETGSGKSILLDSLELCFGQRGDKDLIRVGEESLKVQALFCNVSHSVQALLTDELAIECDGELLLEREYGISGKNVARINGSIATTTQLKRVSALLVGVHGQHEHQSIVDKDYQLSLIDEYIGAPAAQLLSDINERIDQINANNKILQGLGGSPEQKKYFLELYTHQRQEILAANIAAGEYDRLTAIKTKMSSSEKISNALTAIKEYLTGMQYGVNVVDSLKYAIKELDVIRALDDEYDEIYSRLTNVLIEAKDMGDCVRQMNADNDYSPKEYERIDDRIEVIKKVFRKYGGDLDSVIRSERELSDKIDALVDGDAIFDKTSTHNTSLCSEIEMLQMQLSALRMMAGDELAHVIQQNVVSLGMENARLYMSYERTSAKYTRRGGDSVEMMFSANEGFDPKALSAVASGGEMSRLMLAYKTAVSSIDGIDTLIFDEIDTGISGDVGQKVADNLKKLSANKQLIVITHLPTIASRAERHILVSKRVTDGSTYSCAQALDAEGMISELSRMLGAKGLANGRELAIEMKKNPTK